MKDIDRPLYVRIGQQLKTARLKKNYSLQDVADLVGKNKATIKRYEDATVRVDMDTLEKIANILDLQIVFNGNEIERNFGVYPRPDIQLSEEEWSDYYKIVKEMPESMRLKILKMLKLEIIMHEARKKLNDLQNK